MPVDTYSVSVDMLCVGGHTVCQWTYSHVSIDMLCVWSTCCVSVDSQRILLIGYCYKLWSCCILMLVLTQVCRLIY